MGKIRVLVVDDEEIVLHLVEDTLSDEGYQVTTTPSARQAIQLAAQANFDFASKDLARNKDLLSQGFVAKSDVDSAQQKYDVAKAQLDSAHANSVQLKLRQMDVDAARSAVKQERISRDRNQTK